MAGEEPPYLAVGTDVSAKYKGAFCEAKVKKVIRSVKCKVTFKNNLGTVTVPDDHVKGTLRANAHVEVRHPEKNQFFGAIINKLHDHSQYTVVFDDGDETTLRRTSLCLKSGRHFAESETLDQLPLTHPEHFGTPVMGSKGRKRRSLNRAIRDEGSSDEEMSPPKKKEAKLREPDPDIGKVVCVEVVEKKKSKDNWFPALVVSPSAQDSVKVTQKEEYLVRSFKDGKYYCIGKRETKEFTREVGSKVDNNTLKTAVEKAQLYNDRDELPPHWDREILFRRDISSDEGDSNEESDSETSDDEPSEEKDRFVAQLYKFMDDRGTPINKAPTVSNRDLNLYKLFKVVQKLGGYNRVTNHMQWKTVYTKMGLPGYNTSSSHQIKQAYKKYLHSFENFYRKLGCTMGTSTRAGRMRHRTGRNIILTRDRDREFRAAGRKSQKQENKPKKKDEKGKKEDDESDKTKDGDDEDESKGKDDNMVDSKDDDVEDKQIEQEKLRTKEEKKLKKKERSLEKKKVDKEEKGNRMKSRRKTIRDDGSDDKNQDTTDDGEFCSDIDINVGDKVRVKYGRGRQQKIYEAKVLELEEESGEKHFYVHYTGWNMRYDEWVKRHRIVENLSLKVRKGRSAGFPKNLPVKVPAKRGRPPIGAGKTPSPRKIGLPTMSSRSRATRSDKNSLNDSPFVNGLEPQRRPRMKSGHTPRSKDSGDESSSDEMEDSGSSSERKKDLGLSDEKLNDEDDDEVNKSDEEDNSLERDEVDKSVIDTVADSAKKKKKRKDDLDTSIEENEDCQADAKSKSKLKSKKGKEERLRLENTDDLKPKRRGRKPKVMSEDDDSFGRSDDEQESENKSRRLQESKIKTEQSDDDQNVQRTTDDVSKVKRRGRRKTKKKLEEGMEDEENDADDEAAKPTTDEEKDTEKCADEMKLDPISEPEFVRRPADTLDFSENVASTSATNEVVTTAAEYVDPIARDIAVIQVESTVDQQPQSPGIKETGSKPCSRLSPVMEACSEPIHKQLVSVMPDLSTFAENKLLQPPLHGDNAFDVLRKELPTADGTFAGDLFNKKDMHDPELDDDLEQLAKHVKRKSKLKDEEQSDDDDDDELPDEMECESLQMQNIKEVQSSKPKADESKSCKSSEEQPNIFSSFITPKIEKIETPVEEPMDNIPVPVVIRSYESCLQEVKEVATEVVATLMAPKASPKDCLSYISLPVEEVVDVKVVDDLPTLESNLDKTGGVVVVESKHEEQESVVVKSSPSKESKRQKCSKRDDLTSGESLIGPSERMEEPKKKVKDEEKRSKEGKPKKSKEKKSKTKKEDVGTKEGGKEGEKMKKKEGRKRKDEKSKKMDRMDSDMESMESTEVRKKEKKSRKSKQEDKRRDGEPAKKKSKKKLSKEERGCDEDSSSKKSSRKSDKLAKMGKRKKKKGSSSDDQEGSFKAKVEKDHNKKSEKQQQQQQQQMQQQQQQQQPKVETSRLNFEEEMESNKQDSEEDFVTNLLMCQEDVPMSPVGIDVPVSTSKQEMTPQTSMCHSTPFEMKTTSSSCSSSSSSLAASLPTSLPTVFASSSSSSGGSISSSICSSVKESSAREPPPPSLRFPSSYSKSGDAESSTVLDNTPPTTPESADSILSESILHEQDSISPSRDEDSTKSGQESSNFNMELDSYGDVSRLVCHESVDFGQSEAAMVLGSMGVQVYEKNPVVLDMGAGSAAIKRLNRDVVEESSSPNKKRKKNRRRSHSASEIGKGMQHFRHSTCKQSKATASDSDDAITADQSSFFHPLAQSTSSLGSASGSCTGSDRETLIIPSVLPRSPRSSKFNFFVELDDYSNGAERIQVLQEKLSELRKTYMALKAEVACIDRRRKKLRRKEKEATAIITSTAEVECS